MGRAPAADAPETLAAAQRRLTAQFRAAGLDTPALDARLLVTAALGLDAADGIFKPEFVVPCEHATTIEAHARRRLAREPVSRILGRRQFYGLDFEISPATLDPRPDTEILVDAALQLMRERSPSSQGGKAPTALRILDLGTGSGAVIIALLAALPEARGSATDISAPALQVAARNAARLGVSQRLQTIETSWFDGLEGPFDLIVSNPPYIPRHQIEHLDPEVAAFDPPLALDGGPDGLAAYRSLIPRAGAVLAAEGWLVVEIGQGQENGVSEIAAACRRFNHATGARQWLDLAGCTRCVAFQARETE